MEYLFTLIGLSLLIVSGNYLIIGSVQLARFFKLSSLVIGATVIAFGTSAPELLVSVKAATEGHPDIAVGNVIGSNIANIALVLALTTLFIPIYVQNTTLLRDWFFMFFSCLIFSFFILNDTIGFWEGLILFIILLYYIYRSINDPRKSGKKEITSPPTMKLWIAIIIIIASSIGLAYGAELLVKGASQIARNLGVSEKVIAISLIAFGTSVPELTASIIAAIKKETDISIGNIIGSNIFNIYAVIGISTMIHHITITDFFKTYALDLIVMTVVSVLLLIFMSPVRNGVITRLKGSVLLLLYITYIGFLIYSKA
jgi:cation:H+ antiporter